MKRIQTLLLACAIAIGAQSATYAWQVPGLATAKKYAKPAAKVVGGSAITSASLFSTVICLGTACISHDIIQEVKKTLDVSAIPFILVGLPSYAGLLTGTLGGIASFGMSILGLAITYSGLKDAYNRFTQPTQPEATNLQNQQQ